MHVVKGSKYFIYLDIDMLIPKRIFTFFFPIFFHLFLVKVLPISSLDQNRIMPMHFTRKIPKLNYIHLILSFGGLFQILQYFYVK